MQLSISFSAVRLCPTWLRLRSPISCLTLLSSLILCLAIISPLRADTVCPHIDESPSIDNFQYDDGTGNGYWWMAQPSTISNSTGHEIFTYTDGVIGHTSTIERDVTGKILNWTIDLGSGGNLSYTDGASAGLICGFVQQTGAQSLNKIVAINGATYQANGNRLAPFTWAIPSGAHSSPLASFTYNGTTYQAQGVGNDYAWRTFSSYAGGITTMSSSDILNFPEQIAVVFPNGQFANYIGAEGFTYTYQPNSTASNSLTKLNGYPLYVHGNTASLAPLVRNFVWNGNLYTLGFPIWQEPVSPTPGVPLRLVCFYHSDTAYYDGSSQSPDSYINGEICSASFNPDGSLISLWVQDTPFDGSGNPISMEESAALIGGPSIFSIQGLIQGNCSFTAINGHPYVTSGIAVTPVPPVASFVYDGKTYVAASTAQATDGSMATSYTAPNGGTATVNWSRATDEIIGLKVKPTAAAATASYVNGESVGRPGVYVWSAASTSPNQLTQINSSAFTPSADAALPTGGYANSNGVFDVKGNFMSLGSWSNDANHVGFSLSYDDGEPVTVPASIEFTASRPLTTWLWSAASADGSNSTQLMQLDHTSRLMLYPPSSNAPGAPAVPTPTVVLSTPTPAA